VIKSAIQNGDLCSHTAISQAICAISTNKYAPTLSAIFLNLFQSIFLEYADAHAIINLGLCSIANFSISL